MDIMLKWIAYVILSAAETWIGYRLFNTYLTRNSVRQRYYWLGVIFYFTFQMFSYVNESRLLIIFSLLQLLLLFSFLILYRIRLRLPYCLLL